MTFLKCLGISNRYIYIKFIQILYNTLLVIFPNLFLVYFYSFFEIISIVRKYILK